MNSTDAAQVTEAARALGLRGSVSVKQPLLDRLARLNHNAAGHGAPEHPVDLMESVILTALFQNRQLELTSEDVAMIRASCVTANCRHVVDAHGKSIR